MKKKWIHTIHIVEHIDKSPWTKSPTSLSRNTCLRHTQSKKRQNQCAGKNLERILHFGLTVRISDMTTGEKKPEPTGDIICFFRCKERDQAGDITRNPPTAHYSHVYHLKKQSSSISVQLNWAGLTESALSFCAVGKTDDYINVMHTACTYT